MTHLAGLPPGVLLCLAVTGAASLLQVVETRAVGEPQLEALVLALGPLLILGIAAAVAVAIASSYATCRALGLPQRMAILVACGNSICGNAAIAAALPPLAATANLLTTVSMAALGLGVDVRGVARASLRVTAAVTASLVVLGGVGVALIRALGVA